MILKHEFEKISSNKLSLFISLFLVVLNIFLLSQTIPVSLRTQPHADIKNILNLYSENPSEYHKIHNTILDTYSKSISTGHTLETYEYSSNNSNTDLELFSQANIFVRYYEEYPELINSILHESELRKLEFDMKGEDPQSFSYIYQDSILSKYRNHLDILSAKDIFYSGWDIFFRYDYINIFSIITVLILSGQIINIERISGILPLITTTKYGRRRLIIFKTISSICIALITTLFFNLTTYFYIDTVIGFSSASSPIQILHNFSLVPYYITISDAALILLFNRCLTAILVSLITLFISVFFEYIITYLLSITFITFNAVVWILPAANQYKYCNIFTVSSMDFFSRYRAVLFCDIYSNHQALTIALYFVLILTLSIAIFLIPVKKSFDLHNIILQKFCFRSCSHLISSRQFIRPSTFHKLFFSEVHKHRQILIIVLIIFSFRFISPFFAEIHQQSSTDKMYQEYMDIFYGDFSPEKLSCIIDEKKHISSILAKETNMRISYELGTIDESTYRQYQEEFFYCSERNEAINRLYTHAQYLQKIYEENSFVSVFFYDEGIVKLIDTSLDPYLIVILLLVCCTIFLPEHRCTSSSNSMRNLIRTTQKGRWHVYYIKLFFCVFLILTIALSTSVIDFIRLNQQYDILEYDSITWNSNIRNIELYSTIPFNFSCCQYFFFVFAMKMTGYILIAILCFCLSSIFKKELYTYISALLLLFLPFLIGYTSAEKLNNLSPLSICNPNKLFLTSQFFYYTYLLVFLLIVILNIISHKKWNNMRG